MCAPAPPPPPDYAGAAAAQGAANVDAAKVQGRINNPNVINPYGTQTVTWDGDTPTLTQTLSPQEQQRVRRDFRQYQRLSAARRADLRRQWQQKSRAERQQLLRELREQRRERRQGQ